MNAPAPPSAETTTPTATPDRPARPDATDLALSDSVAKVEGVGTTRAKVFARLGVATVGDLLRLAPRRFEDRRHVTSIAALVAGTTATVIGRVLSCRVIRARRGLSIVEAAVADETGETKARWFNQPWLSRSLRPERRVLLHGLVKETRGRAEMAASAVETLGEGATDDGAGHPGVLRLVPVHPLTTGLSAAGARRAVWNALGALGPVCDPLPASLRGEASLPSLSDGFRDLHFPDEIADSEAARRRLAFDELLVHELCLARRRRRREQQAATPFRFTPTLDRRIRRRIPFALTAGQERALGEIVEDLRRPTPMNRLLQGDVGCGKTVVAAYACLAAVANGLQAAFMAPTEVLARQHEATLASILRGSRVRVATLHGGKAPKERRAALAKIAAGDVDLVIGTHAVISKDVRFLRLGLVVVDEQHKFGVRQRRDLVTKGPAPHALVMTATPIPRTLAMVVYGDLDLSLIEGKPPGRGAVTTWVASPKDGRAIFQRVFELVEEQLDRGRQVFVIYPLVEESDRVGLRDATAGRVKWAKALPRRRVGLLHGRMPAEERVRTMDAFRRKSVDVLVATVVIEVGVDVPNATVLVVEHAERFGLSQLHQLRGRIGRGEGGGLCVLVDRAVSGTPDRLRVLATEEDGFRIAEEDLRLRGAGDLFGTRQHGSPGFFSARLPEDMPVLLRAREAARRLLAGDSDLLAPPLAGLQAMLLAREQAIGDPTTGG